MSDNAPLPTVTQDATRAESMMRWGLLVALCLGCVTDVAAIVGWFLRIPDAVVVMSTSQGLIFGALGAKAWQSQAENKGSV